MKGEAPSPSTVLHKKVAELLIYLLAAIFPGSRFRYIVGRFLKIFSPGTDRNSKPARLFLYVGHCPQLAEHLMVPRLPLFTVGTSAHLSASLGKHVESEHL